MDIENTRHICQNCGFEYEGNYCPQCGQKCELKRITFANVTSHVFEAVTCFDAKVPRTCLQLFYRPGLLISDYLQMRRVRYSNPFGLLLILATVFMLICNYLLPVSMAELSTNMSSEIVEITSSPSEAKALDDTLAFSSKFSNWIYGNYGVFLLVSLPMLTIPMRLVFRTKKGPLPNINLCECATTCAYLTCQMEIVSILSLPLTVINGDIFFYSIFTYIVLIPLFVFTLWQMFKLPKWEFFWRMILFGLCFLITSFIMVTIFSILFMIFA